MILTVPFAALLGLLTAVGNGLGVVAGDFDGDGHLDLAVLLATSVLIYYGDGTGGEAWAGKQRQRCGGRSRTSG